MNKKVRMSPQNEKVAEDWLDEFYNNDLYFQSLNKFRQREWLACQEIALQIIHWEK